MTSLTPSRRLSSLCASLAVLLVPAILTGCAGFDTTATPSAVSTQTVTMTGSVKGGQQAIGNAQVYLFTPGTGGYGSASTSLLNTNNNGSSSEVPGLGYVNTGGIAGADYVITNAKGQFTITGDFTCTSPTEQVYALAYAGNPTGSSANNVNNTAIMLISPVGQCQNLGSNFIAINELTTVATVTALQQFMTDATDIGTSTGNAQGLNNAFALISDVVSITAGTANSTNVAGTGTVPTAKINELGNILASCINTPDPTTGGCPALFSATASAQLQTTSPNSPAVVCPGGTGCVTNTVAAMLQIAQNPTKNVATLHNLPQTAALAFGPDGAQPNDYGLDITYSGGGLAYPQDIVVDASGNAFISCAPSNNNTGTGNTSGTDALIGISPRGAFVADYTNGIHSPTGIAFDLSGNLWSTNDANGSAPDQIQKLTSNGTPVSGFPVGSTTLSSPLGIAIETNGGAWVTNPGNNKVIHLVATGAFNSNYTVTEKAGSQPVGIGIDNGGFVYVALAGTSKISRFSSVGGGNVLYSASSLSQPSSISIDNSDNIWAFNQRGDVTELAGTTGAAVGPAPNGADNTYQGVNNAQYLAIDGAGTAWIPSCQQTACGSTQTNPDEIIHVAANGNNLNDNGGAGAGQGLQDTSSLNGVGTLAFDGSGNLWVTNSFADTVTEYLGVAAPVVTPLISAVQSNKLGARP